MKFFRDILLPLSRTNIAALFVIMFIYGWNQYLWPILMTTGAMVLGSVPLALAGYLLADRRRRRAAAKPPLKMLGDNDVSGKPMTVKDGRFGPYVTDGTTNASLRRGDDPEQLTDARANELLSERRAKEASGETKKKSTKKSSKKTTKKKATKKATKKSTAKKSAE